MNAAGPPVTLNYITTNRTCVNPDLQYPVAEMQQCICWNQKLVPAVVYICEPPKETPHGMHAGDCFKDATLLEQLSNILEYVSTWS